VALVPIKQGNSIIGLIHCADRRENRVPLRYVQVLENVSTTMGAAIQRNLSQDRLRESLAEKEVLLREVHHRVKNNLATIIGLLKLQRQGVADPAAADAMNDLGARIKSMALVHESLYRSENLDRIDFQDYLKALVSNLRTSFGARSSNRISIDGDVEMGLDDAIPCGMIVNELVTNALKYAFPGGKPCPGADCCEIAITMDWDGTVYTLAVADNGMGLPVGLEQAATKTLGLRIVKMLGEHQLGGTIEVDRTRGTRFTIRFSPRHRR
jgi:two-component sensor histidine kinase